MPRSSTGRKRSVRRAVKADVFFFARGRRGVLMHKGLSRSNTITDVRLQDVEFPTESFYVPDFLEDVSQSRVRRKAPSAEQVKKLTRHGRMLLRKGDLKEARKVLEYLVTPSTRDASLHTLLGKVYLAAGERERALVRFEVAVKLNPKDVTARVCRGELQLGRGRVERALKDLTYAVHQGRPKDPFVTRAAWLLRKAQEAMEAPR